MAPAGRQRRLIMLKLKPHHIRFAGSNRLLLEFDYHGQHHVAEPYSVRRAATIGNILLYAWETDVTHIKAFNGTKMQHVRATSTVFSIGTRIYATDDAARPATATEKPDSEDLVANVWSEIHL